MIKLAEILARWAAQVSARCDVNPSIRSLMGLAVGLAGMAILLQGMNKSYPIYDWILWRYVSLWFWLMLFSAACTSFGQLLLVRALRLVDLPALESAVMSMILGTLSFVMLMYLAGTIGLFNPWFAVAMPLALLALGFNRGVRLFSELWRELRAVQFGVIAKVAAIFGVGCLGLSYFRILTPDALGYDAVWFYVKIAQDYVRWGRIQPFPGDYSHALPHLASLLYTWGYLLPGLHVAQRWIFILHLELCLTLWTLAGIAAAVARQVDPPVPRSTWVVFFLFPSFFVYGIWGTAEHITAFFSIGVALAILRAALTPSRATFALLAVPLAGGILTKYQAIYIVIPTLGVAVGAWILAWQRRWQSPDVATARRELIWAPLMLVAVFVVLVAPHFLQNIIYHHNPVYPFQQQRFVDSVPVVPSGWLYFEHGMKPSGFVLQGSLFEKLVAAGRVLLTPSLMPRQHGTAALSLFVLVLPAILFVRRRGTTTILAVIGFGALWLWAMILADLRHLVTFTPILVAVTAGLFIHLWRLGMAARLGLVPLVILQIGWIADAPFCDSSRDGINASIRLIQGGLAGRGPAIFDDYRADYLALGRAVPLDAKLLIHTFGVSLGIDRDIVMDSIGFQGLISYESMHTPHELYNQFRAHGITHLVHEPNGNYGSPTKQEDIVFHALAAQYGVPLGHFGGLFLTALPQKPPPAEPAYRALCIGQEGLRDGIYPITALRNWSRLPPLYQVKAEPEQEATNDNQAALLAKVDAVLCPPDKCTFPDPTIEVLNRRFELIGNRISPWLLYLKRLTVTK